MCRSGPAAAGLGCQCSWAVRSVRPMTPSLSARLPRPTGRPRVPNAGPAPVLALWPAAALAPGRVAAHVWHGQTRLGERFHLRCERSAAVTAVASARQECAQLLCLLHFSNRCMHNLRIRDHGSGGASSTRRRSAPSARLVEGLGTPPFAKTPGSTRANHRTCRPCSGSPRPSSQMLGREEADGARLRAVPGHAARADGLARPEPRHLRGAPSGGTGEGRAWRAPVIAM